MPLLLTSLDLLYLNAFYEGLYTRTHLAGTGIDVIRSVYGEYRESVILSQHVRSQHALVSPWVSELDLLVDDAVGLVLLREIRDVFLAAVYFLHVHGTRALPDHCVVAADLCEDVFV